MFSFFRKNKIVNVTKGSHGRHWYGIFDHDIEYEYIIKYLLNSLDTGNKRQVNNMWIIDDPVTRAVVVEDRMITGFPHWKGSRYEHFKVHLISQWAHAEKLEASIQVIHSSGCLLSFFATDYAFNKDKYQKETNLEINIVGLAYILENFDVNEVNKQNNKLQFADDFCSYFPADASDEIGFVGKIQNIQETSLGNIPGFILTIAITSEFNLDIFIAKKNLKIDLAVNKHITGLLWILGTLEK